MSKWHCLACCAEGGIRPEKPFALGYCSGRHHELRGRMERLLKEEESLQDKTTRRLIYWESEEYFEERNRQYRSSFRWNKNHLWRALVEASL